MTAITQKKTKNPKKEWSKKEPEVFYYFNAKKEKLWGYRHRYYDSLGDRREKSGQGLLSENIAIRKLLEAKTDLINGNQSKVDNSNLTISEWLDQWYAENEKSWEITTQKLRSEMIKKTMKPMLGKYKLAQLDRPTYRRAFINVLLDNYHPGSVQLFHNIFRIAINAAVDAEIIPRNRFNKIVIVNEGVADNFLVLDDLKSFLSAAKSLLTITNYTSTLVLAYTGMRRGELQGLKWSDLDFKNKNINIERTRDRHGSRSPKTKKSYRKILIDDILLNQLKLYRKWCLEVKFSKKKQLNDDDYVFISHQTGEAVSDETLGKSFKKIFEETGIKKITPHGLRHTHATILINQRVPVNVIGDRLGNTPQMVLQVYAHSFKEMEVESVDMFSQAMNL